jgi:hypothetical protein
MEFARRLVTWLVLSSQDLWLVNLFVSSDEIPGEGEERI